MALFIASLIFLVLAGLTGFAVLIAKTADNLTGATAFAASKVAELRSMDYGDLAVGGSTTSDVAGFFDDLDLNGDGLNDFHRRWQVADQGTTKRIWVYAYSELQALGMPKDASITMIVAQK